MPTEPMHHYRIIDSAGGELGVVDDPREAIETGEKVVLPDGSEADVIDVYDDPEVGQEGGVTATLAVDVE